jgi:YVTN family beta-propeller protein
MRIDSKYLNIKAWIFLILFAGILSACATTEEQKEQLGKSRGQLTVYLNGPEKPSLDITFDLFAVNIVQETGIRREVMSSPVSINSGEIKGRQILLGERLLPAGSYRKIHLFIKQAIIKRKGRVADLRVSQKAIEIPANIVIREGQNTSLFLNWNADASFIDGYRFEPAITVKTQVPELSTLLIFVTNEDSDNVSVINRQSGEVVATIMVGRKPRGIEAVQAKERSRVYVVNSGSNSVSVIDPTTNKVENEIYIKFGSRPEGIAVAELSSEQELIYVSNYATNSVSVIDSTSLQEIEKIDVGNGPTAVEVDPPVGDLLSTRHLSFDDINTLKNYRERHFNVYVANRKSNTVSVLRIDKLTGSSEDVINLDVEWGPSALAVDYKRGKVYVSNYDSDKLSVIDIIEIIKGNEAGAVSTINNIGSFITDVIADQTFERLYLLKEVPGEVMIVRPYEEDHEHLRTVMPPVMGIVPVGDSPAAFILDPESRKLYVVNRGSDTVSVIDRTTKKEERTIPVGRRPFGIAILRDL